MANARNVEDSNRPIMFRATHFEPGRRHDNEPLVIYDYDTNLPIGPETKDAVPAAPSQSALDNAVSHSTDSSVIVVEICG